MESESIPENIEFSPEQQFLFGYLTAPENSLQVMTWMSTVKYFPYYTPAGIHSMTHDINQKLMKTTFGGRIYFDVTRYNSRGMGLIYGSQADPDIQRDLSSRLEQQIKQEAIDQSKADPSGWEQMQSMSFYFPTFETGPYPEPKPPVVVVRLKDSIQGVTFLTKEERTLLEFIIEENGYVDEVTWQRQQGGMKKLASGIERINAAMKSIFSEDLFIRGNTFPLGYALEANPLIRHTKLRENIKPQFNINRLGKSENIRHLESRYLSMPTKSDIQVTLVPLDELQRYMKVPPVRVSERFPYALIMTSNQSFQGTERFLDSSIFMEISELEAGIIRLFKNKGELNLKELGFSLKEQDALRKGFSSLLKRIQQFGYTFVEGTGVASRTKLIFPESVVKRPHFNNTE